MSEQVLKEVEIDSSVDVVEVASKEFNIADYHNQRFEGFDVFKRDHVVYLDEHMEPHPKGVETCFIEACYANGLSKYDVMSRFNITEEQMNKIDKEAVTHEKQCDGKVPVRFGDVVQVGKALAVAIGYDDFTGEIIWAPVWSRGHDTYLGLRKMDTANVEQNRIYQDNAKFWLDWGRLKGINGIKGTNRGKTVFILGNGPSLEINSHLLQRRKDAIVLGCNAHFNYMPSNILDYYFMIDYEARQHWFENYEKQKMSNFKVITRLQGNPMIADTFPRSMIYHFCDPKNHEGHYDNVKYWKDLGWCGMFTSVLTAMFYFAFYWLDAPRIVFVGADHAFTDNLSYPDKAAEFEQRMPPKIKRDVNENMVISNIMYELQATFLDIQTYFIKKEKKVQVINATEGGILGRVSDKGQEIMKQMSLEDVYKMMDKEK